MALLRQRQRSRSCCRSRPCYFILSLLCVAVSSSMVTTLFLLLLSHDCGRLIADNVAHPVAAAAVYKATSRSTYDSRDTTSQRLAINDVTAGLLTSQQRLQLHEHNAVTVGMPCSYEDSVDLRVIVLACQRPGALSILLDSLSDLLLDGATASLEIWVDRLKNGSIHAATLDIARNFTWKGGVTRVHVWPRHVGIYGQWIDTWCPLNFSSSPNVSGEMAIILEEDLVVSPHAWRWLRAAKNAFRLRPNVAGYSLQSANVLSANGKRRLSTNRGHTAFAYRLFGTWGFAPHPARWREFRAWFHEIQDNNTRAASKIETVFKPYVDGIMMTEWYKSFEKVNKQDSMWSMWFIYFTNMLKLYTVYNNLNEYILNGTNYLSLHNVAFGGLHFDALKKLSVEKLQSDIHKNLLQTWREEYVRFPKNMRKYEFDGKKSTLFNT